MRAHEHARAQLARFSLEKIWLKIIVFNSDKKMAPRAFYLNVLSAIF